LTLREAAASLALTPYQLKYFSVADAIPQRITSGGQVRFSPDDVSIIRGYFEQGLLKANKRRSRPTPKTAQREARDARTRAQRERMAAEIKAKRARLHGE
jgi:hypothetical protein